MNQEQDLLTVLDKYLLHCKHFRNYADSTLKSYRDVFKLFVRDTGNTIFSEFTKSNIEKWFMLGRINRKWTAVTFRHYHKRLNAFSKWLQKEGLIEMNQIQQMELPKMEMKLPKTVSKNDAQLIFDCSFHMQYSYTFERYRNRAMIGLMLFAGLRKSEVINLKMFDVDMASHSIFVRQAKGHKDRIIPMNAILREILGEYVRDRKRLNKQNIAFITAVQRDKSITIKAINNVVFKLRKYTHISFSAHTLRHSFATLMLEGGCDIYTLSKLMGHAKITTTTIYLSCTQPQLQAAVEKHLLNI